MTCWEGWLQLNAFSLLPGVLLAIGMLAGAPPAGW